MEKIIGVCIVTYNQEQFIAQAIESVLSQKISGHKVRVYIGNDASTDGTQGICEEYVSANPDAIRLINNPVNLGLVGNTLNVLTQIRNDGCDYVAMLDGDDYWCDELKLTKQVSFLESNPDYGLVHTSRCALMANGGKEISKVVPPIGDVFNSIGNLHISNCTVVFRTELLDFIDFNDFLKRGFLSVDYVMYVIFSAHTKFGYLTDCTAVWRRDHASVSNTNDEKKQIDYLENDKRMWQYLGELFPERFAFSDAAWRNYYYSRVFNISFHFQDYELAHSLVSAFRAESVHMIVKKLCARNRLLFTLWALLKKD